MMRCGVDEQAELEGYDPRSRAELRRALVQQGQVAHAAAGWVESLQRQLAEALERAETAEAELSLLRGRMMTEEINADPTEVARLRESRAQARRGELYPGVEDDDDGGRADA